MLPSLMMKLQSHYNSNSFLEPGNDRTLVGFARAIADEPLG
jgi:hypothetical protein